MIKFKGITIIFLLLIQYSILYAQRKPNLVIIHTDEHNFRTLSCYRDKMNKEEAS